GSIFLLRWTLNLTNGLSFNAENSGQSIKGGAFYNSPFAVNIAVSLEVPSDKYVGTYTMTQVSTFGGSGVTGDKYLFGNKESGTVTIEIDPNNKLNGRVFDAYGAYGVGAGFSTAIDPVHFVLTADPVTGKNYTSMSARSGTGLSCGNGGIYLGSPSDIALQGIWTPGDDSQFTLSIVEDVTGDCASSPKAITFKLTKK